MYLMILFNIFIVPLAGLFLCENKIGEWSAFKQVSFTACFAVVLMLASEVSFRILFRNIDGNMIILSSFKYSLISITFSFVAGFILKLFFKWKTK